MSNDPIARIWINPWKYYNFTAGMNDAERDSMMERVLMEAQAGNEAALKQFDFVCLENPYFAWRRQRQSVHVGSRSTAFLRRRAMY
jgi:hypothetical protein